MAAPPHVRETLIVAQVREPMQMIRRGDVENGWYRSGGGADTSSEFNFNLIFAQDCTPVALSRQAEGLTPVSRIVARASQYKPARACAEAESIH